MGAADGRREDATDGPALLVGVPVRGREGAADGPLLVAGTKVGGAVGCALKLGIGDKVGVVVIENDSEGIACKKRSNLSCSSADISNASIESSVED